MTEYKKEGVLFKYIQDAKEILQECTIIYKKVNEDREMLGKLIFKFHKDKNVACANTDPEIKVI